MGVVLLAGCSLAGHTFGGYVDDAKVTGNVKVRLAARHPASLTRVSVDTFDQTVYLTGIVDTPTQKSDAEIAAWQVPGVQQVVNDIQVREDASGSALPDLRARHSLLERLRGLVRVEASAGRPPAGAGAAYDAGGRLVATVYTVSMRELAETGVADLRPIGQVVDHVAIYLADAHPDLPLPHVHVVLWHVSTAEAAALR